MQGNAGQGYRLIGNKNGGKTIRPGKELARLVVADITMFPGIRHKFSISNNKVPSTCSSIKEEASRDITKMTEILPLRG
jgi:hypothetical protein